MISKLFFSLIINLSIPFIRNSLGLQSAAVIDDQFYNNYQVVFVSAVFRHGDRAPDSLYPGDPNKREDFNPPGLGKLTTTGLARSRQLGIFLRERYKNLLNENYIPNEVIARSTDFNRTKMSMKMVLEGLYPDTQQEIPFSYHGINSDLLLLPTRNSVKYGALATEVNGLEKVRIERDQKRSLKRKLMREVPGFPSTSLNVLYYTLTAEIEMRMKVPEWAQTGTIMEQLQNGVITDYKHQSFNNSLRRMNGGFLIKNITESMTGIAERRINDERRIQLFSAHDGNIAAILYALGVFTPHVPQYSSCVLVELLRDDKEEYHVCIRYNWRIPYEIKKILIPGCSDPCPLGKFVQLMKDVTPIDDDLIAYSDLIG